MNKPTQSGYYADVVKHLAGSAGNYYSITDVVTKEQADRLGMALENAFLGWDRNEEQEFFDSIESCENAYFEGAWQEVFSELNQ